MPTVLLQDGFSTTIGFAADADVEFVEISVTPPGMEAGGKIDQSTMANTAWRTASPKSLKSLTDGALVVAYDPQCYNTIKTSLIGVNNLITITWPDGATLAFWGWLDSFTPNELVEGERPTANCVLIASNLNASNVETAPAYTAPA